MAKEIENEQVFKLRFGALLQNCRWMCYLAAKTKRNFDDIREKIISMTSSLESVQGVSKLNSYPDTANEVMDPVIEKTKGQPTVG